MHKTTTISSFDSFCLVVCDGKQRVKQFVNLTKPSCPCVSLSFFIRLTTTNASDGKELEEEVHKIPDKVCTDDVGRMVKR